MASQASSVLTSVSEQDWSNTHHALHPLTSSSLDPSTVTDGDSNRETDEGEKLAYKRTSEVWGHSFTHGTRSPKIRKGRVFGDVNTALKPT